MSEPRRGLAAENELEDLRRALSQLAGAERQLRSELDIERGSHEADGTRLEAEIRAQGDRLAERERQVRRLRERLDAQRP